jgi:Phage derived protein Gp49-like (DUF891)
MPISEDQFEFIAYEGKVYRVEWYYDESGYSQAFEYAEALRQSDKSKLAVLLAAIGDAGEIHNKEKFRYEGDKIFAFKPKPHRFLSFFFAGSKVIITNPFVKKQDKLPSSEKERAVNLKRDYEQRVKKGTYYESS